MIRLALAVLLLVAGPSHAAPAPVRVRIETSAGPIVIAVDRAHAPLTAANFLAYVDQKRFDGTTFYRAARNRRDPRVGLVQGGIQHVIKNALAPVAHEPTTRTGLRHVDGTVSMARNDPGTAMGDFFVVLGDGRYLDAGPGRAGYAAFGRVVAGMDTVRRILALPTFPGGFTPTTRGQTIRQPVRIVTARRVR